MPDQKPRKRELILFWCTLKLRNKMLFRYIQQCLPITIQFWYQTSSLIGCPESIKYGYISKYIHQISIKSSCSCMICLNAYVTKYAWAKTGEYPLILPYFEKCTCYKNIWRVLINKHNSPHFVWKCASKIFVLGHYLLYKAHSLPWALLSENCLLFRTDNVCGQYKHVFMPNGIYCLFNF